MSQPLAFNSDVIGKAIKIDSGAGVQEAFVLSPVPLWGAADSSATEKNFSIHFPSAAYPTHGAGELLQCHRAARSMRYTSTNSYAPGVLETFFSFYWSDALTISRKAVEKL